MQRNDLWVIFTIRENYSKITFLNLPIKQFNGILLASLKYLYNPLTPLL